MRNIYKLLAFAGAFLPTALVAQTPQHRFTHQGVSYVYTVTPAANGRKVIEGHSQPGGSQFRLVVDGDRVDGVSGGQPVAFRAPRAGTVTLAAK